MASSMFLLTIASADVLAERLQRRQTGSTSVQVCAPRPNAWVHDALGWVTSAHPSCLDGIPAECTSATARATYAFGKYYEDNKAVGATCAFGNAATLQDPASLEFPNCAYPNHAPPDPTTEPTPNPTAQPIQTSDPTQLPTADPTSQPSPEPTAHPVQPTPEPTAHPVQPTPELPNISVCAPRAVTNNLAGSVWWVENASGVDTSGRPQGCDSTEARATWGFSKYFAEKQIVGASCDFGGNALMQPLRSIPLPECAFYENSTPAPIPATTATPPAPSPSTPSGPPTGLNWPDNLVDGPCGYADDHCARSHGMLGNPDNQDCYGYSGQPWLPDRRDFCTLFGFGDRTFGLYDMDKDPSFCNGPVFYLWDEPPTHGMSYELAGTKWVEYANRWRDQLRTLRERNTKIVGISVHNGDPVGNQERFLSTCTGCLDAGSVTKLDGLAYNAFVGWWSEGDFAGSNRWSLNAIKAAHARWPIPVYITNYSYLGTDVTAQKQLDTMQAASVFFETGSPVVKIMWFSAWQPRDCTENGWNLPYTPTTNCWNGFDTAVSGTTLGEVWLGQCRNFAG